MSLLDTAANIRMEWAAVYVQPAPTREAMLFQDVQACDVLELPHEQIGRISDVRVFGKVRRLGPTRYRVDEASGIIQVIRPPASGMIRVEWMQHHSMAKVAKVSSGRAIMTMTTTYGGKA